MLTLTAKQMALMNEIDERANAAGALVNRLKALAQEDPTHIDPRWIAIAQTELQQGFMALRRAIGNTKTF